MRTLIVGGNAYKMKPSTIVATLTKHLEAVACNGYKTNDISCNDLVIWMPEIPNHYDKKYPVKDKGSVLICSKVIHDNKTEVDAVKRIFYMHGNAVICIYKDKKPYEFRLIDALGNDYPKTDLLEVLANQIKHFYRWSKGQIRTSYAPADEGQIFDSVALKYGGKHRIELPLALVQLNTRVADMVENSLGARYFGNFSTRCMKLFPSARGWQGILVSPRNIDKKNITKEDCILVTPPYYFDPTGQNRKYSVDTPCQVALYQQFPEIRFMIHGHAEAFVHNWELHGKAHDTKNYYPCGDLREVSEIAELIEEGVNVINLKNHGFLLVAKNLSELEGLVNSCEFKVKKMLQ